MRIPRLAPALAVLVLAATAVAVTAAPAAAAVPPSLQLSAEAEQDLRQIESYLNSIRTVRARFSQVSSNGQAASGQIALSRPGRLRIDYDPPSPVLVVADGSFLIYYDRALDQVSYVPLGATPAGIILDQHISLAGPALTVLEVADAGDSLRLMLTRSDTPGEGTLSLFFTRAPWALSEWEVTDAQGITTRVTLSDAEFGVPLDSKLFEFRNPRLPAEGDFPSGR
jgi:outer membrane lipoprotein-sorting protein